MNIPMEVPNIPEDLTFRSVECRILRACKTIRALPDKDTKFLHRSMQNSIWGEAVNEWDAYGAEEARVRFQPTAYDCGDVLKALGWVNVLKKAEFKIIWWYSFEPVSFSVIAGRIGRSPECARARYMQSMSVVWMQALAEAGVCGPAESRLPWRRWPLGAKTQIRLMEAFKGQR